MELNGKEGSLWWRKKRQQERKRAGGFWSRLRETGEENGFVGLGCGFQKW